MKRYNVGIVGATGLVGRKILEILVERDFPIQNLFLFASSRSHGKVITCGPYSVSVEGLNDDSFKDKHLDFVLFSAGKEASHHYAPLAAEAGAIVVDNSSCWRMDPDVPLVVAEVNPEDAFKHQGIIANPNCSTIQSVLPLKGILDKYGLDRVSYTTYQAVSGAGIKGIEDLKEQKQAHFPHHIHKNILPHIDAFDEDGYTFEEKKMIEETRKILHLPNLKVTATTVRVPIENTHAIAINASLSKPFELNELETVLEAYQGLQIIKPYPTSEMADGQDDVLIGRIRKDPTLPNSVHIWCVADNIRKGAATNTVQIAELFL
ncbi:aspartate-semialdehyde dehydrogenase [Erysipelothrix larvae]|uniref:Aspartate-semialdehyde dehydrogenase n=1 Tax=Erysipelothrix larvae TaxID=1514105 RepID=A0A0X8GZS8_9FIRM|nr:aspartate-semialdehyde dehydrogenase [Erysipelothrix larvae]AMC93254.1 aspartate-semialdehyde dehydrogenase [Erysipelothrix larvae]